MRIFLTGSTGFIGNALVWKLVELGYNLNVLCRPGSDRGPLWPVFQQAFDVSQVATQIL